jgi:hypothetical protein
MLRPYNPTRYSSFFLAKPSWGDYRITACGDLFKRAKQALSLLTPKDCVAMKEAAMRRVLKSALMFAVPSVVCVCMSACQQGPKSPFPISRQEVQEIIKDLRPWVNVEKRPRPEQKSFEEFCRFLAIRRRCDDAIGAKQMEDKEAVEATQPLIDHLAALGKPTEDVLIQLLEARKGMDQKQRKETLCGEDPEIYATITLWNMQSARAVPMFMELARNKEIENRAVFVRGLGRIGDPKALDLLKEMAEKETAPEIQSEAKTAFEAIQKRTVVEKK